MRGITKRFPGVLANDHVDFDVLPGEIHALFGENGAGKSTLMRILYGLYQPDEGEIRLRGDRVAITSPAVAIQRGIGMIHQHFMLVQTLTVAENVALGVKSSRGPLTDLGRVSRRIRELSETYGLKVDPDAYIWQLSVGERQRVEIIKALYREVSLLVLDEPTAVLTPHEVRDLFAVLSRLVRGRPVAGVHLAQGRRGARAVRPDHGAARRPEDRHGPRRRCDHERAGRHDGRARGHPGRGAIRPAAGAGRPGRQRPAGSR